MTLTPRMPRRAFLGWAGAAAAAVVLPRRPRRWWAAYGTGRCGAGRYGR